MKTVYVLANVNPFKMVKHSIMKGQIEIKAFFAQKSIVAFSEKGININRTDICLENKWAEEQCYSEITKDYVKKILHEPADFLFMDALGSVIPIRELELENGKTEITYSSHMMKVIDNLKSKYKLGDSIKISEHELNRRITEFCAKLLTVYEQSQIIIHMAGYPDLYMNENLIVEYNEEAVKKRRYLAQRLNYIYDYFQTYLPNAQYIKFPVGVVATSENQHFNYTDWYMRYLALAVLGTIDLSFAKQYIRD